MKENLFHSTRKYISDMITEKIKFVLKPYTKKELTSLYEMPNIRAFDSFIKPFNNVIGKKKGLYYTVLQVEALVKCVGFPKTLQTEKQRDIKEFV